MTNELPSVAENW